MEGRKEDEQADLGGEDANKSKEQCGETAQRSRPKSRGGWGRCSHVWDGARKNGRGVQTRTMKWFKSFKGKMDVAFPDVAGTWVKSKRGFLSYRPTQCSTAAIM